MSCCGKKRTPKEKQPEKRKINMAGRNPAPREIIDEDEIIEAKIVLLGDSGVGKSSIA